MVRWLTSLFLLSIPLSTIAQADESVVRIRGIVVDSVTNSFIPDVHIIASEVGTISKPDGSFVISVVQGTTLSFTHISYRSSCLRVEEGMHDTVITIKMQHSVRVLRPVTVSALLSEEGMKEKILQTENTLSCEEQIALDNSRVINSLGKIAIPEGPTREEIFFQQLLGPQDVTILSSNPNSGIFKVIRNLTNPESPRIYQPKSRYRSDPIKITPFKVREHLRDSLPRDTLEVLFVEDPGK